MNFVARKQFANVKELGLKLDEKEKGFIHQEHVHKGARFSYGKEGVEYIDLPANEKQVIGQLLHSGCAVIDNTKDDQSVKAVAKIDAQVKAERKAEEAAEERARKAAVPIQDLIATAVATAVAQAVPAALKAAGGGSK